MKNINYIIIGAIIIAVILAAVFFNPNLTGFTISEKHVIYDEKASLEPGSILEFYLKINERSNITIDFKSDNNVNFYIFDQKQYNYFTYEGYTEALDLKKPTTNYQKRQEFGQGEYYIVVEALESKVDYTFKATAD